jgi:ribosome biogenesis protein MAK21
MDDDAEGSYQKYDMTKREPIYAGAENVLVWELTVLNNHYHPTIRKFAQQLLKG